MEAGQKAVSTQATPMDPMRVLIHDLRNMLAVIVNYSELIGEEKKWGDRDTRVRMVKAAAERAILLTEKLPRTGQRAT